MSSNIWVFYALGAALCYGLCPTFQKLAFNSNVTVSGVQFAYGAMIFLLGFTVLKGEAYPNPRGFIMAAMFGILGGTALLFCSAAFKVERASPTLITLVVGLFPLIAALSNRIVLKEHILWGKFSLAAIFALLALYFAVQSQPHKAP